VPFNSLCFLFFWLITASVYAVLSRWEIKKLWLLLASYVFYAACEPVYVILLMATTVFDWWIARRIERTHSSLVRKSYLAATLSSNLGLLAYFKYGDFILSPFLPGFPFSEIILPVGISFYTFQTLSYTLDVYKKELKADAKFLDFALFVAFFPQLVAGPIVRAKQFLPQLLHHKKPSLARIAMGCALFIFGIFQKVVLADSFLAPVADLAFAHPAELSILTAWTGLFAFSLQIFFDFCGYSTCAIGLASCFGYRLPQNFKAPYAARGFSDFWRRWHISLSTWFRDYVYIPLGGNQKGKSRTLLNLMCTMGVAGLWHGASVLFVAWGLLHGLLLIIEHQFKKLYAETRWQTSHCLMGCVQILTFVVVSLLWVFFRSTSLQNAGIYFLALIGEGQGATQSIAQHGFMLLFIFGVFIWHSLTRKKNLSVYFKRWPFWVRALVLVIMMLMITYETGGDSRAFIYFQF